VVNSEALAALKGNCSAMLSIPANFAAVLLSCRRVGFAGPPVVDTAEERARVPREFVEALRREAALPRLFFRDATSCFL
jgi:hypothetical protein